MAETGIEATTVRRSPFLLALAILGVIIVGFVIFANLWTDWLWFASLNSGVVFTTRLVAQGGLFLAFGLVMAALIASNMFLAYRLRPKVRSSHSESELVGRLRDMLDYRAAVLVGIPATALGLLAGLSGAANADTFLAWRHGSSFGEKDPYFGLDAGFYVFSYPWWRLVIGFFLIGFLVSLIAAAFVHFMTGAIAPTTFRRGYRTRNVGAQVHLSVLAGLAMLVYGVSILFDRLGLTITTGRLFTGVHYTDQHSRMSALLIMMAIAFICAGLFFANAALRRWSIPGVSLILMIVASIILSGIYPWWVQTIDVNPNEPDKERPFIAANIAATRKAFGIDHVEIEDYEAVATVSAGQLRTDAAALPAIRLMDPAVIAPTFEQLQQVRGYYSFPKRLDIDRYEIKGVSTDAVVAVRELNIAGIDEKNWNNIHTVYTHGYGLVAAYGNKREVNGEPQYIVGGIPTVGVLPKHEPRIYFGEQAKHYVVVGAPAGSAPVELDTPGGGSNRTETKNTYTGEGGIRIGNLFTRILFSIKFGDINLLLTDRVNSESKILYDRTPIERVAKVAPWLTLDSDAYPTVVDGRIVWIVDGYTTSGTYPNSTAVDWDQTISEDLEPKRSTMPKQVNYVRNSVKAVVDAFDGSVKLYAWDESDPILQTWQKVFPGTVSPKSEISSDLLKHMRYPQDLFKVQRSVLGRYHTQSPFTWFQRSDIWQVPADPKEATKKEPPYYLTIKWPGDESPTYSQTAVFVPLNRQNLSVYLAANSDASSKHYGRLRVLKLSDSQQIAGPAQTFNAISTDSKVAERLLPFTRQGNTKTIFGNLLTLPVGGGLLYVQPIYTQINDVQGAYPALRFVAVRFGEHVGIGSTLQQALDQVFQGDSGATTGENPVDTPTPGTTPTPVPGTTPTPAPGATPTRPPAPPTPAPGQVTPSPGVSSGTAKELLAQAGVLFDEADAALKAGDLARYQAKINQAKAKVLEAMKVVER